MFSRQVSLPRFFRSVQKTNPRDQIIDIHFRWIGFAEAVPFARTWLLNNGDRVGWRALGFQGDKLFGYWLEPSDVIAKRKFTSKFGLISICLRLVPDNLVFSRMLWYLLRVLYVTRVCVHLMRWIDHHNCRSFAFYIVWEVVLPAMLYLLTSLGNGSCWRSRLSPNTN